MIHCHPKYTDSVDICITSLLVGRDSSAAIANSYGLDGPGVESRWRRDFSQSSRPVLGSNQPPIQSVPYPSRDEADGAWR
jgi:hypothetical protein